jgi:signal transduction histidine kinase
MFGGAVFLSLSLVLVFPYLWMQKLTTKGLIDINQERANLVYWSHFRPDKLVQSGLPALDPSGAVADANGVLVNWIRFGTDPMENLKSIDEPHQGVIRSLLSGPTDDDFRSTRVGRVLQSRYYKLFRAGESCIVCHNPQGSARTFSLNEPIGVAIVSRQDAGGEIRRIILVNRIGIVVAGLIGGIGAMVAFYWITQRVILSPIRQLRAMANNVADGNLDIRSTITTGDEYERLAQAFNHMLDNLQVAQDELRTANRQLDLKIVELSERNIELYKANKLKSEFLGNISHEFRTPLNSILGFAQVLKDRPTLLKTDKGQRYAENIITSGNRLLQMINELLQLAKAEAGKLELRIEQGSLPQICEALVSSFLPQTHEKRLRIKVTLDPAIPLLRTDIGKVQQVLYNLFSNAVKFTSARGQIEIKAHMLDDKRLRIAVIDTGCGIAKAHQEHIFEKFRQVDGSLTRQTPGTGLGLAISRELAILLSGQLSLESEPDKGSTFWLDIPVDLAKEFQESGDRRQ